MFSVKFPVGFAWFGPARGSCRKTAEYLRSPGYRRAAGLSLAARQSRYAFPSL